MRKASIMLAIAACAASSMALAQQRESPELTLATTASVETDSNDRNRGKSGFGQVMSVLTTLLQDAAHKEATGASATASQILSSEESAVTISVTPVAGSSTFFVDKHAVDNASVHEPRATRSARVATTPVDAPAAQGAQVAVQGVPD